MCSSWALLAASYVEVTANLAHFRKEDIFVARALGGTENEKRELPDIEKICIFQKFMRGKITMLDTHSQGTIQDVAQSRLAQEM